MNNISKQVQWKSNDSLHYTYSSYEYDRKKNNIVNQTVNKNTNKNIKYKKNINPSKYNFSSPHFYLYHYN